jgi:DNA helicase II / ATP-dependent DNA helicase PcrA
MFWRDPTAAEHALVDQLAALVAAAHADGPPPAIGGHLRVEGESGAARDLLLGSRTALGGSAAILDWRTAPLAEVFFRHGPGEPYELEIDGRTVAGRVVARHVLELAGPVLVAITGDDIELRASEGGDWQAREVAPPALPPPGGSPERAPIVLDPDQQRAVDLPPGRSLVVDGEAGVGKTLVALYRTAALARRAAAASRRFRPLMLVPTEGLRRLCRRIADRLAIPRLELALVDAWLVDRGRAAFPRLPPRTSEDASAGVIALKRHPAVRDEIARMVDWRPPRTDDKVPRVRAVLHELFGDQTRLDRIVAGAATDALPPRTVKEVMAHTHVQFTETTEAAHRHVDADRLIALDGRALDAGTPTGDAGTFDAEDVPVLFELARRGVVKLAAGAALPRYDHIVLDEAQLRSPLELAAIGDALAPDAGITLAGDHRQDTDDSAWFGGWDAALAELGRRDAEKITLEVGYRSAPEIAAFARAIVEAPPAALPAMALAPEPSGSGGRSATCASVVATAATGDLAQLAALARGLDALTARDPWRSITVIARNEDHARRLGRDLARAADVNVVLDGSFTFGPGIVVTAAAHVAGLEFDAIVVPDLTPAFWPARPETARALYVACTRARDWLWLTTPGAWSPLTRP